MFNATKKARRVYVEKIDLRTTHNAKTDIFRVSVGDCILFDGTPDEMKKLVSILQSFPEIGRNNREFMSKGESMEINRILKKSNQCFLKPGEIQFLMDMRSRVDKIRKRGKKKPKFNQIQ